VGPPDVPISLDYVTRETASNLWRNRLMSLAAVLTVIVSLTLVGASLLLGQGASQAEKVWTSQTEVKVWMVPTAALNEVNAVGVRLRSLPLVSSCTYWDHQADYKEAVQLDPTVMQESGLHAAEIPTSWRCHMPNPLNATTVQSEFSSQPGVFKVTAPNKLIHTEHAWITALQYAFLAIALILLISATVLILNTIRMAIFARRREVSVMKLVGATNWFIRVPFMSEGMIQGLVGSAVAAIIVWGVHGLLDSVASPGSVLQLIEISGWQVFFIDLIVVFIGMVIGTIGSAVAIRRFLDV
jgi:cell division transport system permease protein